VNDDILKICHNRGRKQFTGETVALLEKVFIEDGISTSNKVTPERIQELIDMTDEDEKRLKTWYKNKADRVERPPKPVVKRKAYTGPTLEQSRQEAAAIDGVEASLATVDPPAVVNKTFNGAIARRRVAKYTSSRQAKREEDCSEELGITRLEIAMLDVAHMGPSLPEILPQVTSTEGNSEAAAMAAKTSSKRQRKK
jgi:hypothetical protein